MELTVTILFSKIPWFSGGMHQMVQRWVTVDGF
jgi:hypothetical protein